MEQVMAHLFPLSCKVVSYGISPWDEELLTPDWPDDWSDLDAWGWDEEPQKKVAKKKKPSRKINWSGVLLALVFMPVLGLLFINDPLVALVFVFCLMAGLGAM